MGKGKGFARLGAAMIAIGVGTAAIGQSAPEYRFDVPAQDLKFALRAVTREAGLQLFAGADDLRGRRSPELHAATTVEDALQRLLARTGLQAEIKGNVVFIRGRAGSGAGTPSVEAAPAEASEARATSTTNDIVVTGSHIRGAGPTSELIESSREDIERSGQTNLGDFIRTIPQNFGGGQAPGIVNVQGSSENVNSGSNLNLRGLGPDATLTLINGHRVAYDAAFQGVDIAAIPLAALDRIEIVPDGASALYGSDAVGGVANVILRRDFDGLETSARLGAATDGGDEQQEYSAVVGRRWSSGGVMGVVDYSRNTEINARERSYTRTLDDSETLLPAAHQVSAVITGHQQLGDRVEFDLDATYNDRRSTVRMPFTAAGDYLASGTITFPRVRSYSVTPSLRIDLPARWQLTVTGTFADSRTDLPSVEYANNVAIFTITGPYKDRTENVEATAEGPLLTLPGGDIRLAVGGGYRTTSLTDIGKLTEDGQTSTLVDFDTSRNVAFGYGELSVPLIGDRNATSWAKQLLVTGAVRYEDYRGISQVASPKFGVNYRPFHDLTIKASWGKSFKAPTLYQEGQTFEALLFEASSFGYPNARSDQTGMELVGGNPKLKPEKATTWTTTLSYEPGVLPGLKLEASYFHINYRNRIISPLNTIDGVYSNASFQDLITSDPSSDEIASIIARAPLGLENYSGQTFNPSNVVLVVDNSFQNSARQAIRGIDMDAEYHFDIDASNHVNLSGSATYLTSREKLTPDAQAFALAGTIFNPPHWRARAGASWDRDRFGLSAFVNYTGGTLDNRFAPFMGIRSFTTLDTVVHLATATASGIGKNIQITFSALDLLNQKPAFIRTTAPNSAPYDATNVSVIGRMISLTVSKRW